MKMPVKNLLVIGIMISFWACTQEKEVALEEIKEIEMKSGTTPDSVLLHNVFFSFKETTTPADIKSVVDAFRNLQNEIDGIEDFKWGENSSPEGLNQGLTHAFVLTFHSAEARDAYLPHPAHKAFGDILSPHLDKVTVVDFWTRP